MALPQESQGLIEKWAAEHGSPLVFTGMGMIKAAQKTTQAILANSPEFVLNLGTAGSRNFDVGTLVECTEVCRRDSAIRFLNKKLQIKKVFDLPETNCGSADFVDSSENAKKFGVLDFEAYALASVCNDFKIPCSMIKYVTDSSNHNAKEQWEKNTLAAAKALSHFLNSVKCPSVKN